MNCYHYQLIVCVVLITGCAKSERASAPAGDTTTAQATSQPKENSSEQAADEPVVENPPFAMRAEPQSEIHSPPPVRQQSADVRLGPMLAASQNQVDDTFAVVQVFYGTDRTTGAELPFFGLFSVATPALLAVCFLFLAFRWRPVASLGLASICVALTVVSVSVLMPRLNAAAVNDGTTYGNGRGELAIGVCEVTIPKDHVSGELESPSVLRFEFREDQTKHVVLADVHPLEHGEFFDQLGNVLADSDRREILVFVHGYNVSFEDAARRTAQIAYDLKFSGAPVFFSWPSQGGLVQYTVDENNVQWCVPDLKRFLVDLREKSGADAINLIAHSMGNRAMTSALRELAFEANGEGVLFNEVVLAAPDIDASVFRDQIAPLITKTAKHVTMYASANDQALLASEKVHGHPRAGNSASGVVVVPGIETIDVSQIDTSLLGHSYVGDCQRVLVDMREMIQQSLRAAQRGQLTPIVDQQFTWWQLANPVVDTAGGLKITP